MGFGRCRIRRAKGVYSVHKKGVEDLHRPGPWAEGWRDTREDGEIDGGEKDKEIKIGKDEGKYGYIAGMYICMYTNFNTKLIQR